MQISCFPLGPVTEVMHQTSSTHFTAVGKQVKTAFTIISFSCGLLFHWAFCRKVSMLSIFISLVGSSHRLRESHGSYSGRTWSKVSSDRTVSCSVLAILGFSIGLSENVRDWEQKCSELRSKQPEKMWRIWRYLKIFEGFVHFHPVVYTGPVCSGLWHGGTERIFCGGFSRRQSFFCDSVPAYAKPSSFLPEQTHMCAIPEPLFCRPFRCRFWYCTKRWPYK